MYFLAHNLIFVSLIPHLRLFCLIEEVKLQVQKRSAIKE